MSGQDDIPGIDPETLARAEAALASLSDDYLAWVENDITAMRSCLTEFQRQPVDAADVLWRLFRMAHDVKGQAQTFGYPLATEIGARLCRLIKACADPDSACLGMIAAHIEALAEVIGRRMSGDGGEAGKRVLARLE